MVKKILSYSLSIVFIFLIWVLSSHLINSELILPGPAKVFSKMLLMFTKVEFWKAFAFSFLRVIASFFISVISGTLIGFVCSVSNFMHNFFELPVAIIRSTPVVAVILTALFWFKSDYVPVFVAVLMALPVIITSVYQGFTKKNEKLLFMAQCFNFNKSQIFRYVTLPELKPHFFSGCQSTFGLCWKVVAAGEVLSLPKAGFGAMISKAQVHLESAEVMAITIILVLVSFFLEKLVSVVFKNAG